MLFLSLLCTLESFSCHSNCRIRAQLQVDRQTSKQVIPGTKRSELLGLDYLTNKRCTCIPSQSPWFWLPSLGPPMRPSSSMLDDSHSLPPSNRPSFESSSMKSRKSFLTLIIPSRRHVALGSKLKLTSDPAENMAIASANEGCVSTFPNQIPCLMSHVYLDWKITKSRQQSGKRPTIWNLPCTYGPQPFPLYFLSCSVSSERSILMSARGPSPRESYERSALPLDPGSLNLQHLPRLLA